MQEQLNKAIKAGDIKAQAAATKALTKAFRSIESSSLRSELIGASGDLDRLGKVLEKVQRESEATIKSNSAILRFKEADEARTFAGIQDPVESVGKLPIIKQVGEMLGFVQDGGDGSQKMNVALKEIATEVSGLKSLTQKEIDEIRDSELTSTDRIVGVLEKFGLRTEDSTRMVDEITKADPGNSTENLSNIILRATEMAAQKTQDTTLLTQTRQLAAPAISLQGDLQKAFEELADVAEQVSKNFSTLSKMELGLLQNSQRMESSFGAGASRGAQERQVSEFRQQNVSTQAALEMEKSLREFVGATAQADGVSPEALKALERVVVSVGERVERGGSFSSETLGPEIIQALKETGDFPDEELQEINKTLNKIQTQANLQTGILKAQLSKQNQERAASAAEAMQEKFTDSFLNDLRLKGGVDEMGGIESVTSLKDQADTFLRVRDELGKRGIELPADRVQQAEENRLIGNLADILHANESIPTDDKGAGLQIPGFKAGIDSMEDLFKTGSFTFEGLDLEGKSDREAAEILDFDKFVGEGQDQGSRRSRSKLHNQNGRYLCKTRCCPNGGYEGYIKRSFPSGSLAN